MTAISFGLILLLTVAFGYLNGVNFGAAAVSAAIMALVTIVGNRLYKIEPSISIFSRLSRRATFAQNEQLIVMVRPESVTLRRDESLPQATVDQMICLGSDIEYTVGYEGNQWIVASADPRRSTAFQEGETVGMEITEGVRHLIKVG